MNNYIDNSVYTADESCTQDTVHQNICILHCCQIRNNGTVLCIQQTVEHSW